MVSFYPQDSALPVFRQNDYPQILHRGGWEGASGADRAPESAAELPWGFLSTGSPVQAHRSLRGVGPTMGFTACLEPSPSSFHAEGHGKGACATVKSTWALTVTAMA